MTAARRASLGMTLARLGAAAWGAMILAGLVIGATGPGWLQHALTSGGPGCPFRRATGVDCPFCGMTRATLAMGGGDFESAFGFHPLAPLVVLGTLAVLAIVALGRTEALMRGRRPYALLATILGMWVLRLAL